MELSPVAVGNRRDRDRAARGAGARARHRRYPPRRLPAADARAGARPAARRGAGRPRLRAAARHAGRGPADRGERDGLLGRRHAISAAPARRTPRAICSAMSTISAGCSATDPNLRSYATAERQNFHIDRCDVVALLCLRRAKSGGLSAIVSSMAVHNVMAGAAARSARTAVPAVPGRSARRGAGGQGAVLRGAGVQRARRPRLGAVFAPAYRLVAALPGGAPSDAGGYRGARHADRSWPATRNCGST